MAFDLRFLKSPLELFLAGLELGQAFVVDILSLLERTVALVRHVLLQHRDLGL